MQCNSATVIAIEAIFLITVVAVITHQWIASINAERLSFSASRILANTCSATERLLAAAIPKQILPSLLEFTSTNRNWSEIPATAEPDVTIIFVRFPHLSHAAFPRAAVAAVAHLSTLWDLCDATATLHGCTTLQVNDIEYIGVVGLRGSGGGTCNENAAVAVRAGLAILKALPREFADVVTVSVHSGPVLAGFVGTLRPRFNLVGDTINMASRIAKFVGKPGGMTVSATTFERVAELFDATERVAMIKNRGDTSVFDITREKVSSTLLSPAVATVSEPVQSDHLVSSESPSATVLTRRFAPLPFNFASFIGECSNLDYSTQHVSQEHSRFVIALLATLMLYILLSAIFVRNMSSQLLWIDVAFFIIAVALELVTIVPPHLNHYIFNMSGATAGSLANWICKLALPFLAHDISVAALACVVIVFFPSKYLKPFHRCIILALTVTIVSLLGYFDYYRERHEGTGMGINAGSNSEEAPSLLWVWLAWVASTSSVIQGAYETQVVLAQAKTLCAVQSVGAAVIRHLLPRSLFERIKSGHEITALTVENKDVAVLVADIAGFNALYETLASPEIVFEKVNSAFREFERVAHAEGAFKVKAIGNSIVFTSGLRDFPGPAADCAARVALLARVARGLHAAASHLKIQLRIGIHVGFLVSGVMNSRGFVYDVWGEGIDHAMSAEASAPPGATAFTAEAALVAGYSITHGLTPGEQRVDAEGVALRCFYNLLPQNEDAMTCNNDKNNKVSRGDVSELIETQVSRKGAFVTHADAEIGVGAWSWSWDVLSIENESGLPSVALSLLRPSLACGLFSEAAAVTAIGALCASYGKLPFHNAFHGVAVTQSAMMIARTVPAFRAALSDFDVFLLGMAALGHDAGHRGFSNAYEFAARSSIALTYGVDGPVLERFHTATTLSILQSSGVLELLDSETRADAMHTVTAAIMATDMLRHDTIVADLAAQGSSSSSSSGGGSINSLTPDAVIGALIHCADLSAHAFPNAIASKWAERIAAEFSQQVSAEVLNGLPITSFMIGQDKPLARARLQAGFCGSVVAPLWRALSKHADGALDEPLRNIEENTRIYVARTKWLTENPVISIGGGFFSRFETVKRSEKPLVAFELEDLLKLAITNTNVPVSVINTVVSNAQGNTVPLEGLMDVAYSND